MIANALHRWRIISIPQFAVPKLPRSRGHCTGFAAAACRRATIGMAVDKVALVTERPANH